MPTKLGDLNDDDVLDVFDLTRLREHIRQTHPLPQNLVPFADLTEDGFINEADSVALIYTIVGASPAKVLPLDAIRETSPFAGESGVALTREVIVRFAIPLSLNAVLTTWNANTQTPGTFNAEAGGRKLLTRVELSGDRLKATLFFLEIVPASTRVIVTFNGTGLNDLLERPIDPEGDGTAGGVHTFTYDTAPITPVIGTGIIGHVYASERAAGQTTDTPLAGVLVRVVGSETLFAHTAGDGSFSLSPCPVGRFFVEVDGRESPASDFPNGDYYPYVGKAWEALPGRLDNLAGGTGQIYLPLVHGAAFQSVSATQETIITVEALPGVQLIVPANDLFADDGTRGGNMTMAAVAPDRLPEPLPPGLNFPEVITIQTDGATNFDRPVPVRFPNLPDPLTGRKGLAGEKAALWSFNHDTGVWEIQGPMTVSDDGTLLISDVGVGIRQPGWHAAPPPGTSAGSQGDGEGGTRDLAPDAGCDVDVVDLYSLIESVLANGYDCAKAINPGKIARGIACLAEALRLMLQAQGAAEDVGVIIRQALNEPDNDTKLALLRQVQASLSLLQTGLCLELDGLLTCGRQGAPLGRIRAAYTCLHAAIATLNDLCGLDDGQCQPGWVGRQLCTTIAALQALLNYIDSKIAILTQYESSLFQAVVCGSIGSLKLAVDEAIIAIEAGNRSGQPSYVAGTPSQEAALENLQIVLDAELAKLALERPKINALQSALTDYSTGVRQVNEAAATHMQSIGSGLKMLSGIRREQFYYYIVSGELEIRGTSGSSGGFTAIMPPSVAYSCDIYYPAAREIGRTVGVTGTIGTRFVIPPMPTFSDSSQQDTDSDGLSDAAEQIIGTNPQLADTDMDGISDGAEISQGTDPLSGVIASTGIVGRSETPGYARDGVAVNNALMLADQGGGVAFFATSQPSNPVRLAQFAGSGDAYSVGFDGRYGAAATRTKKVDLYEMPSSGVPRALRTVGTGADTYCVTVANGVAYVGLANGQIVAIDIASALELVRLQITSETIHDIMFAGDTIYCRSASRIFAVVPTVAGLSVAGNVSVNSAAGGDRLRLSAGEGLAYAPFSQGYTILSLADPLNPAVIQTISTQQFAWRHFVPTGSGLGLGAVGVNPGSQADIDLYDVGPSGANSQFLTTFVTPGSAEAVSIYNGLAFVADGDAGLTVVNYKAYDALGLAPTITISTGFPTVDGALRAEEGKLGRVTATVFDDVQVRNVEFYVDGQLAVIDGNVPFEHRFLTPLLAPDKTSFTLRAKATDTGGNSTWSGILTVTLVPDATPPRVVRFLPPTGSFTGSIRDVAATFSEPINRATLTAESFVITGAGPDGLFNTVDDFTPVGGGISYREPSNTAFISFSQNLPPSLYRLVVRPPVGDLAGNVIAVSAQTQFRVFSFQDSDGDGIPDDVELILGLDPFNPDSDGNGIRDGDEDYDQDGLSNAAEIAFGLDPLNPDSNGNGILDGDDDHDHDGLSNRLEALAGTDPNNPDTDGDGWNDETEVTGGSSPLDSHSRPIGLFTSTPPVNVTRLGDGIGVFGNGSIIAEPPIFVTRILVGGFGSFIAPPPVFVTRIQEDGFGTFIAEPQVFVEIQNP